MSAPVELRNLGAGERSHHNTHIAFFDPAQSIAWGSAMTPKTPKGPYGRKAKVSPCKTLGDRIRAIRLAWGWTQGDLAHKLGAKQQLVSHWERGIAEPSAAAMASLCAILNIDPEAMASGKQFSVPDMALEPQSDAAQVPPGYLAVALGSDSKWKPIAIDNAIELMRDASHQGHQMWLRIQ